MEPLVQMNKFEVIDMPGMNTIAFVVEKNECLSLTNSEKDLTVIKLAK